MVVTAAGGLFKLYQWPKNVLPIVEESAAYKLLLRKFFLKKVRCVLAEMGRARS